MPDLYSLGPFTILRSEPQYYGTYAAYNCSESVTEPLTEREFMALELLSREAANLERISSATGMKEKECRKFLDRMMGLDLVRRNEALVLPPRRVRVEPERFKDFPVPILSAPATVDVMITRRCNLKCVHCYVGGEENSTMDLPLDVLKNIFDQLEELGVFEVRINGGEPLMHPGIKDILTNLRGRRLRKVMLTNGTLIDEDMARLLRDSGVIPSVSIDDPHEEDHDLFRGVKGAFNRTMEGVRVLQSNGVQYGIICCLHKRNLKRVREMVDLALANRAARIIFAELKLGGRLLHNYEWMPSLEENEDAGARVLVERLRFARRIAISSDVISFGPALKESVGVARRGYVTCPAGIRRLSIDSDGGVYPCNLVLSDPKWVMGNVLEERLLDIWFSGRWMFFRGGVAFKDLRLCSSCKKWEGCKYFYCRLLPYITDGDTLGVPPGCSRKG